MVTAQINYSLKLGSLQQASWSMHPLISLLEIRNRVSKEHHACFVVSNQERSASFDQVLSVFNVHFIRNLGKKSFTIDKLALSRKRAHPTIHRSFVVLFESDQRTPDGGNEAQEICPIFQTSSLQSSCGSLVYNKKYKHEVRRKVNSKERKKEREEKGRWAKVDKCSETLRIHAHTTKTNADIPDGNRKKGTKMSDIDTFLEWSRFGLQRSFRIAVRWWMISNISSVRVPLKISSPLIHVLLHVQLGFQSNLIDQDGS